MENTRDGHFSVPLSSLSFVFGILIEQAGVSLVAVRLVARYDRFPDVYSRHRTQEIRSFRVVGEKDRCASQVSEGRMNAGIIPLGQFQPNCNKAVIHSAIYVERDEKRGKLQSSLIFFAK